MALPSLDSLTTKQKVIGLGIVAVTGIVAIGQKDKKKLPSGGIADYLKSLGGGGGGGGGGGMRSASPKPSSQDEEGEEEGEEEVNNIPLDPGLANPNPNPLNNLEEDGGINTEWLEQYDWWQNIQQNLADAGYTSTEGDDDFIAPILPPNDESSGQGIGQGFGSGVNSDEPWDWAGTLQQNIADGTAFSWLNDYDLNNDGVLDIYQEEETTTTPAVYGCTEVNAYNYNPEATVDNGSCISRSASGVGPMLAEGETKSKLGSWLQQFKDEDSDDEDITAELPIISTPPPALVRRLDNQKYPQTVTLARFRQ